MAEIPNALRCFYRRSITAAAIHVVHDHRVHLKKLIN